ncbi:hypothetical protein SAMN05216238_108138 [Lentibacillus persicus]|uniref:Sulfotransferase domain-containing protein n=1 Tax=Lentibacillus persicus TaxID=640948 RepID=A0A1I1XV87_9BACI|nr:hypothetical protein [Lentibacillus persicus]SFE11214.1 hypothetical protein SAMN05216238_108138 [Lentibacillus persicus]
MKKTIYLHIGYHKTATTFLQWSIFPKLKKVKLIRKTHAKDLLNEVRLRKLDEDDVLRIRNAFDKKGSDKKPTLISYEGWSGSPFSQKKSKSAYSILQDLRRIFPEEHYDVHLIIGIRKQVDLMTSLYIEFLHQGGNKTEADYIDELERNNKFTNYLYNDYLDAVEKLFGKNYFIFIYENFKKGKDNYLLELLNYLGVKKVPEYSNQQVNRSYGVFQAKMARKLNTLFKTQKNPDGKIPEIKIKLKRNYSKKMAEKLLDKKKKTITLSPRTLLQNKLSFKLHYKRYHMSENLQKKINRYFNEDNEKLAQREGINLPSYYYEDKRETN